MLHKFKTKLRAMLISFLGVDEEIRDLKERNDQLYSMVRVNRTSLVDLEKRNGEIVAQNDNLMRQFDISADVDPHRHGRSWAVISIQGKADYVRFVDMSPGNVRELQQFLKMFDRTNQAVDTPYGMRSLFKWK